MPNFEITEADYVNGKLDGIQRKLLKKPAFEKFNEDVLGLGDVGSRSVAIGAIAAVFDLVQRNT